MLSAKHHGFIDIEVLAAATLSGEDMAYMNAAREEFQKLDTLIRQVVIPAAGGYGTPMARELDAHLENVRMLSANFCWRHRHLGASHNAKEVRHA
ncbi:hypothetical protein [Pseudomonas sp. NBRC 100443]|uniref:hypothetical protein n=1 Tax=Pseudomonas sp. NBRC 100443 TaxID=1113665 RepID=UPI0024A503AB|nr:hypothetical protein [Pseudomonas sp. NBRC 100443]GLU41963.1 hypothetical protein Pssp01_60560 [Pseudomonas sp. NBRC 100443]